MKPAGFLALCFATLLAGPIPAGNSFNCYVGWFLAETRGHSNPPGRLSPEVQGGDCFNLRPRVLAESLGESAVVFKPVDPAPILPGTRKKQTHKMSPWQTPKQSGDGDHYPAIQAKCGDDLHYFWNSEKHGLFLMPSGKQPWLSKVKSLANSG